MNIAYSERGYISADRRATSPFITNRRWPNAVKGRCDEGVKYFTPSSELLRSLLSHIRFRLSKLEENELTQRGVQS